MINPSPSGPGVRYPPPLLFVLGIVAGWLLNRAFPLPLIRTGCPLAGALVGWLLVCPRGRLPGMALATFRGARTRRSVRTSRPLPWSRTAPSSFLAIPCTWGSVSCISV